MIEAANDWALNRNAFEICFAFLHWFLFLLLIGTGRLSKKLFSFHSILADTHFENYFDNVWQSVLILHNQWFIFIWKILYDYELEKNEPATLVASENKLVSPKPSHVRNLFVIVILDAIGVVSQL